MYAQMGITHTVQYYNSTIEKAYVRFAPNFVRVNLSYILARLDYEQICSAAN